MGWDEERKPGQSGLGGFYLPYCEGPILPRLLSVRLKIRFVVWVLGYGSLFFFFFFSLISWIRCWWSVVSFLFSALFGWSWRGLEEICEVSVRDGSPKLRKRLR